MYVLGDFYLYFEVFGLPGFFKAEQALAELLAQVVALPGGEDLLVLQLVELQDIGYQAGQPSGCVRDRFSVLDAILNGEAGLLQHGAVVMNDGQRGL